MDIETDTLDNLVGEIKSLKEAKEILKSIYLDVGPYGSYKVSQEALDNMNKYFRFDDSE